MPELYIRKYGKADRPPVLFLHGFMGTGSDWSDVARQLAPVFSPWLLDLPGHGESVYLHEEPLYGFEQTALWILETMQANQIGPCPLVGYSLGGRLALYLAVNYPERFTHLIVESASPGIEEKEERSRRLTQDAKTAEYLCTLDFTTFLENWYAQPLFRGIEDHLYYFDMIAQRQQNEPDELARALEGMSQGAQDPLWDALPSLKMPVLLIAGETDIKYREILEKAGKCNANFNLKYMADAGHNTHFQNPQAFADVILEFIQQRS